MSCGYCGEENAKCTVRWCDQHYYAKCQRCDHYGLYNTVFLYGCDKCCGQCRLCNAKITNDGCQPYQYHTCHQYKCHRCHKYVGYHDYHCCH